MNDEHKDDLTLKNLNQYYGTENYFQVLGFNVTDGIGYIMQNGYSWIVTDFLAVAMFNKKIQQEEFISVELIIQQDKTAQMKVTDGNENILYTQKYKWTNCERNLNLFFQNKVLMLSGEY